MVSSDALNRMKEKDLLKLRFCDLKLKIEGTVLQSRINKLYKELEAKGLLFRPHIWISEEWFTPDGVPGFAVPFYLLHPRLIRLERKMMYVAEGSSGKECMKILRHEAGHAIDHAFRLHFKKSWRETFGAFTTKYPKYYIPKPNSMDYVLHFNAWYAQAHPTEDFAETFALWLAPGRKWEKRYEGWPALNKILYVDSLMNSIKGQLQVNSNSIEDSPVSEMTKTLGEHYDHKCEYYSVDWPDVYDKELKRVFPGDMNNRELMKAVVFLQRSARELRLLVSAGTGIHNYTLHQLLDEMIIRCRQLNLRLGYNEAETLKRTLIMLTVQTMNLINTGIQRIAL